MQAYLNLLADIGSRVLIAVTEPAPARDPFRSPVAFRSAGRVPDSDHQARALQKRGQRADLVFKRRYQYPVVAGERGQHMGRVGYRGGRAGASLWCTVARLANPRWRQH